MDNLRLGFGLNVNKVNIFERPFEQPNHQQHDWMKGIRPCPTCCI